MPARPSRPALRRGAAALLLAGATAAGAACVPVVTVPGGGSSGGAAPLAGGALVFGSDRAGGRELFVDPGDGGAVRQLTDDDRYDSWYPRLSPDRTQVLFQRTPAGVGDRDYTQAAVWVVDADGTDVRRLLGTGAHGWEVFGHPEWSPDGRRIALFAGPRSDPEVYVVDADGGNPVQVTRRPGVGLDPSWSPDGETIAFVGCAQRECNHVDYEIFTVPASGGEATRLTDDALRDHDPYFSPDGGKLAFITQASEPAAGESVRAWNVRRVRADGSDVGWVTRDGRALDGPARWSAGGRWLVFHRLTLPVRRGFEIHRVQPDGDGLQVVDTGHGGVNEYPTY